MRFGVAGFPPAFTRLYPGRNRMMIFEWLRSIGLDALELQMTYGPRMSDTACREYAERARDCDIKLSVHASYFIVLTSGDHLKLAQSRETLKRTFDLCHVLGADAVILHPGSLYGSDPVEIQQRLVNNLGNAMDGIGQTDVDLFLETAGRKGQFGSVSEIITASRQLGGVFPCIDFGHVHARTGGLLADEYAVRKLFDLLSDEGCFSRERRIHFHYTPIEYGPKGEVCHRPMSDQNGPIAQQEPTATYGPPYLPIANCMREWNLSATVISEARDSQEEGAVALKEQYSQGSSPSGPGLEWDDDQVSIDVAETQPRDREKTTTGL
jgi:deoxyribonuclease-4